MKLELAHDFIAKKIYEEASIEDKARVKATKLLRERYGHYATSKNLLLTAQELQHIRPYLRQIDLSNPEQQYIEQSQQAIRRAKMINRFKDGVLIALFCSVAFSAWGFWERQRYFTANEELMEAQDSIGMLHRAIQDQSTRNVSVVDRPSNKILYQNLVLQGDIQDETGTALANAELELLGATVNSDENGQFKFHLVLSAKQWNEEIYLIVKKQGYKKQRILLDTDRTQLDLSISLEANS